MVLRYNLYRKVIFLYFYLRRVSHSLHQASLYLGSCVVGMVKDTELRVSSLAVKVKLSVLFLVEVHSPFDEFCYLRRRVSYNLLHSLAVAYVVTRNHCVLNVLFKVVHLEVGY